MIVLPIPFFKEVSCHGALRSKLTPTEEGAGNLVNLIFWRSLSVSVTPAVQFPTADIRLNA